MQQDIYDIFKKRGGVLEKTLNFFQRYIFHLFIGSAFTQVDTGDYLIIDIAVLPGCTEVTGALSMGTSLNNLSGLESSAPCERRFAY